jgi:hypothetical protein
MGSYTRTYSFTDGTTAYGSQVAFELDALGSSVNNITNSQISSGAAIADSKLAQITTGSKVHGSALTGLASIDSGAGVIPAANGGFSAANQTEVEAITINTASLTPLNANWHPGVAKGWIAFNGTGTIAVLASHNVTSIADNGVGLYTITWATDFSSANYAVSVIHLTTSGGSGQTNNVEAIAAGTTQILTGDNSGSPIDSAYISVIAMGDQA